MEGGRLGLKQEILPSLILTPIGTLSAYLLQTIRSGKVISAKESADEKEIRMPPIWPTLETYSDFASRFEKGFIDYFFEGSLSGENGRDYFITLVLSRMQDRDTARLQISSEPLWFFTTPSSKIIQRGERPEVDLRISRPLNSLIVETSPVAVTRKIDAFAIVCSPPAYKISYSGEKNALELNLVSRGTPFWFNQGRTEGAQLTPSTLVWGLELLGDMTGWITIDGQKVSVKGIGIHEHVIASHIAWMEFGWQDWIWFVFDELYGLIFEMQGGRYKDGGIYLMQEEEYLTVRDFEIDRPLWAFSPVLQHQIPVGIKAKANTDKGTLLIEGEVTRSQPWGQINKYRPGMTMPSSDMELMWKGSFIYSDGRTINLSRGRGGDEVIALYNFAQGTF